LPEGQRIDKASRDSATMRDVAALAGVSFKTVSRVLNLEPSVRPMTEAAVTRAVAALGYRRNSAARSLRSGAHMASIGLVIADLANPLYGIMAKAVESVADREGSVVIIASTSERPQRERAIALNMLNRPVDGLILAPAGQDHRYLQLPRRLGTPVVFLDRPGGGVEADSVVLDNAGGSQEAVEHLIAQGHRRIGYIGDGRTLPSLRNRLDGYRLALAAAEIPYDPALVVLSSSRVELAEAAAAGILRASDPPTAIFADTNRTCIGVLHAVRASGRRIAIAAFDEFELADMLSVPITLVSFDAGELGRTAAELLFARLGGDNSAAREIVLPTRLIVYPGYEPQRVAVATA
jgi:LacI family transcriptional regulator